MTNRLTWILVLAAVALVGLAAWFLWPTDWVMQKGAEERGVQDAD